jgi:hypothetical protein
MARETKRQQAARDFKIVDGTAEGRRVINYLLEYCHVLSPSMPATCDPNVTLFNEGQRSVGIEIASLLANEPARFAIDRLKETAEDI